MPKADTSPCQWVSGPQAFNAFATHEGKTQSARHIKPLHWYIACRLLIEGGFPPDDITPRPPFRIETKKVRKVTRHILHYDPKLGGTGEEVILGGLKTKNVDVVLNRRPVGPVLAVSCKGVTKAFRNLTNRMEETIGECTNLHITYPAMVIGYYALMRANRTVEDAKSAADLEKDDTPTEVSSDAEETGEGETSERSIEAIKKNDIAIHENDRIAEGIVRFHSALREMTGRRGIRDEISRYEAMSIALVEPQGPTAGSVYPSFPPSDSPLLSTSFFQTLYQRYEERFVYGAALLAERGMTTRYEWDPLSPIFTRDTTEAANWPVLDYEPRLAAV
ncbi:hypothetical protein ACNJYD_08915 [Bradyrhizobium sp. DASA03005]|uniref:hypothetical protein n=1 Tax=Bradyrhizobium sp. SPXBL-02 TaxID=3395912 RepID=UPI003F71E5F5